MTTREFLINLLFTYLVLNESQTDSEISVLIKLALNKQQTKLD